jgi:hypothetical protein
LAGQHYVAAGGARNAVLRALNLHWGPVRDTWVVDNTAGFAEGPWGSVVELGAEHLGEGPVH